MFLGGSIHARTMSRAALCAGLQSVVGATKPSWFMEDVSPVFFYHSPWWSMLSCFLMICWNPFSPFKGRFFEWKKILSYWECGDISRFECYHNDEWKHSPKYGYMSDWNILAVFSENSSFFGWNKCHKKVPWGLIIWKTATCRTLTRIRKMVPAVRCVTTFLVSLLFIKNSGEAPTIWKST